MALQDPDPTRSIPACAGEPVVPVVSYLMTWVYPRVCGGAPAGAAEFDPATGLSPRVRGEPASI